MDNKNHTSQFFFASTIASSCNDNTNNNTKKEYGVGTHPEIFY